ncbi:MAG: phage head closure protein [Bacillota bacterium]
MTTAGKLRHRVTLQDNQAPRDSYGAEADNWVDVATVWASVEPLRGREFFAAQQVNSEVSARVRIRYRAGVNSAMRVRFGDRIFDIISVIDPEERHQELQLMVREVVR